MATLTSATSLLTARHGRPKVLVVDDDEPMARLIRVALEKAGAEVGLALSGREALRLVFDERPHVVLLDIAMPAMDGYTVCERMRDLTDVPIIMVTALDDADHVTKAFAAGADDYITKPFQISELLARVQVCLRRATRTDTSGETLVLGHGELIIDLRGHSVWAGQRQIHLTRTEFELLTFMARHRRRVLTHAALKQAIWGDEAATDLDSLKHFVGTLRRKIEPDPQRPRWLVNEHGIGYVLMLD
jgi:two-component system KDP operon response regulator KdpE